MTPRKYKLGPKFKTPVAAVRWILNGGWCYWMSDERRPKHPRVMDKMTLEVIASSVRRGDLRRAVEVKK